MAIGGGVIPVDPSSVHAPGWVIVLAGVVFALAGVMVCTNGRFDAWVNESLALVLMLCFASVFSWVAFGPGEREFTGGASVGGAGASGPVGSTSGRMAFGIGAIMMWLIVAAIVNNVLKRLKGAR
jgi:hypothetical protein